MAVAGGAWLAGVGEVKQVMGFGGSGCYNGIGFGGVTRMQRRAGLRRTDPAMERLDPAVARWCAVRGNPWQQATGEMAQGLFPLPPDALGSGDGRTGR
ncbi:hypothetical protein COCNU_14G006930 [Cocos nucifera]|uniref:Uncharacterized protein n=1 Tax=Cocos nucifera TaxID=13894 RepID=A0A8K0IVE6_COCNU|nr:hypothetical protein COCNU_14G006930 [Cocos nucifera]